MRKAKYDFEHQLAQEIKLHPRAFYAYARSKTTVKEQVLGVTKEDGEMTSTVEETCEEMNRQFQKVFTNTENIKPPIMSAFKGKKLDQCDTITADDVKTLSLHLKTPSAPGPDGVHPIMLKECAPSLAKPLSIIFQKSLASGHLPKDWKRANITPIFKKGRHTDPSNYRPVSLTSVPCKIMEKLIRKRVMEHLESTNFLSTQQHGFRSKMSCLTQLLEYMFDLENALNEGDCIDALYLDCRKAFDTVPHEHLLAKL